MRVRDSWDIVMGMRFDEPADFTKPAELPTEPMCAVGPMVYSPKVLCDHDRVAVMRSMQHWRDALPDEVLSNPGEHSWRVRDVGSADIRMGTHHRVRVLRPDGTVDLLFLPPEGVPCFVRDLSGNGLDSAPGPHAPHFVAST